MLHIHRSACLEPLAGVLADVLRAPAGDPLMPEWVVVGSRPLERWLTARLAERLGVCAHVRFLSPSSLVEEVVEATLALPREAVRAWSADRLTWRILAALPALLQTRPFGAVRGYLGRDPREGSDAAADVVDARSLAFARRVAECFARYAAVDGEAVRRLEAGTLPAEDAWQSDLWCALARDGDRDGPSHLAALVGDAERALRASPRPTRIPERLAWVALPGAAPLHVRMLAMLAATGVAVHALRPYAPPAGDGGAAPLRVSLGRLGDDLDAILDDACTSAGVAYDVVVHDGPAPAPADALAVLRAELLTGGGPAPVVLPADDASWRLHACHGPVRQAEVLRDELLALLDADPTLRPRDVLVLTPDVSLAAPLLEAAFAATGGAAALPLRVLDRPARRTNPVADVALRLLELAAGRVDAVAVLDLVTLPAVAAHFGLDAGTEDVLRRWVRESGVRWGLDGADRADTHGQPGDEEHTWRFGLERLLLGWGLPGDGETLWGGALPLDMAEGSEAERLGRFAEACARVFAGVRAVRGTHALAEWHATLQRVVGALVHDRDELALARRAWLDALDALAAEGAACARPLDLAAVRLLLAARFDEPARGEGAAGAITLAAFRPGRVLPARVIALLGLDDGAWPRPRGGVGFDLLVRERSSRVRGAADPNAEDRQRLLEAVLAAGERLIVTYTGRSLDTNEPKAPAVPVGELLDALDARAMRADGARGHDDQSLPARTLVEREHPLQPFGEAAFGGHGPAPRSHDALHLAGAQALRGPRHAAPRFLAQPLARPVATVVPVDALAAFFGAPERTFVVERLRVRLDAPEALDVDDPLELDHLDRWALRDDVLARLLGGDDVTPSLALQRAAGRLPHGPLGDLAFRAALAEARTVRHLADRRAQAVRTPGATIDRTIGEWRLMGRVGPLFDGGLFEVRAGKVRAKHLLPLWVRHLALHLADGPAAGAPTSRLVGLPDRSPGDAVHVFGPVADAEAQLRALLAVYARAMVAPLPLLPDAAHAYARALRGARDAGDAHRAGMAAAHRALEQRPDVYARRLLGEQPFEDGATEATFTQLAGDLWGPLLACTAARVSEDGA